VNAETNSSIQ